MKETRFKALKILKEKPYLLGKQLGFKKLKPLHNKWILEMVYGKKDMTLQAHRGSYKTTCVSIALVIIMILFPNLKIKFFRKTDTAVKEIVRQVSSMLKHPLIKELVKEIWGVELKLLKDSSLEITTNLTNDPRGTAQLCASGFKSSKTGQHYDIIFTDDVVTIEDRTSRAEREATKLSYQELQNIKNPEGRIINTGTPWHKDDAFSIMPKPEKYDCYQTGLMSKKQIEDKKEKLTPSLFAANYELRHIASEEVIFVNPVIGAAIEKILNPQVTHIDAAYGGEDYTALTFCRKSEGKYYIYGRLWHKSVDECIEEIIAERKRLLAGKIWCETNGDKGYLAQALNRKGEKTVTYHEDMNKFMKIVTMLKPVWKNVVFIEGTDKEYIDQICEYYEMADHDDAPDSASCCIRILLPQKNAEDRVHSGFGY